ncbi:unnamed protein product [Prunus armeniaca]|uniref:Glutaredoxin domain-containing protein n=1 Tax=Prunus armeniaca TaxID=36596 RepID=A0A6J5UW97_PRUAR|nr:unnamed protein product [Prunus armeniaca]
MGCASSKRVEAAVDYKPAPASYAVFDINAIQEPWLVFDNTTLQEQQQSHEKPAHVPAQILDKLKSLETEAEAAPHTWDEVSKALENLKPKTDPKCKPEPSPTPSPAQNEQTSSRKPRKSLSFHTLDELDKKLAPKPADMRKSESMRSLCKLNTESTRSESRVDSEATQSTQSAAGYIKPVKENIFIMRDRMEREKEGKLAVYDRLMKSKRDPLSEYPERCPPGGADSVVVYTTSLRGVRRTFEDCQKVKGVLEGHRVVYDERDVALHGEFLGELRGLLGEESNNSDGGVGVPRVFVKGRYLGGAEELVELNESGVFGRMVKLAGVERGVGWGACEGCGGARFVPCMECGGSCKVVVGDKRERCPKCNENGLVQCVACWSLT